MKVPYVDIMVYERGIKPPCSLEKNRIFWEEKRNPKELYITLEDNSTKENN
jgi:hypothetical protein